MVANCDEDFFGLHLLLWRKQCNFRRTPFSCFVFIQFRRRKYIISTKVGQGRKSVPHAKFYNLSTDMTPLRFLQLIWLRKFKEKILCFPLRVQISAILFQVDCAKASPLAKFYNLSTDMTPLRFLQLIRLRKSKEKISCFPLRVQISAILFQVDCAINQFVTSISESC